MPRLPVIVEQLRDLRLKAGWSRSTMAEKSGLTERTIFNIEHAAFPPSLDTLQRVARVFGRSVVLSSRRIRKP